MNKEIMKISLLFKKRIYNNLFSYKKSHKMAKVQVIRTKNYYNKVNLFLHKDLKHYNKKLN